MADDNKDDEKVLDAPKAATNVEDIEYSEDIVQIFSDDIPYGVYNIKGVESGKYLNIKGGCKDKETTVEIYDAPESWNAQWVISSFGKNKYTIRNTNSGLFVNVKSSNKEDRAKIWTYDDETTASQWIFENIDKKKGIYTIKNVVAGKYLNCAHSDTSNGTITWTWHVANKSSQWQLYCLLPMIKGVSDVIGEAQYTIESLNARGKYINVLGGECSNGQPTILWDNPESLDSRFIIKKVQDSNNLFNIRFSKSQYHYVHIAGGGTDNGKPAQLGNNPDKPEAKWYFDLVDTKSLRVVIRNYHSNLYLNCEGDYRGPFFFTCLFQWSDPQRLATQWYLNPVDLKLVDIKYDLDAAIKGDAQPKFLVSQTLSNNTSVDQTQNWTRSDSITTESWFEYTGGFRVALGVSVEQSVKVGFPVIGEGSSKVTVSAEVETSHNWTDGSKKIKSTTFSINQPVSVPAKKSVKCIANYTECTLDVPYTMIFQSNSVKRYIKQTGTWHGVACFNLVTSFEEIPLNT